MTSASIPEKSSPAFSFYPNDFTTGTRTFSVAECGAYIRLMCHQWDAGSIPDDSVERGRIIGCPQREADKLWSRVVQKFERGEDGNWRNARLEVERAKQSERRSALAANGHRGAERRWGHKQKDGKANGPAIATPLAKEKQPDGLSSSSSFSTSSSETLRAEFPSGTRARTGSGVMAGMLPRDHLNCHQPCIRVCISEKQHVILRERHGGSDADMDAFYADVRANLHGPVGMKPWEFWESQFIARFGGNIDKRAAANEAAKARFLARGAR